MRGCRGVGGVGRVEGRGSIVQSHIIHAHSITPPFVKSFVTEIRKAGELFCQRSNQSHGGSRINVIDPGLTMDRLYEAIAASLFLNFKCTQMYTMDVILITMDKLPT